MSKLYNRKTKTIEEDNQYKNNYLLFLYNNPFGRLLLKILILPFVSKLVGKYYDSKASTRSIDKFIKDNKIDMSLYEKAEYKSFNDFFARKKIILDETSSNFRENNYFVSPADSRVLVYKFGEKLKVNIKDSMYDIEELTKMPKEELKDFENGNVFIFRLCVDDYHRYCFVDNGEVLKQTSINGVLHTVSPASKSYKIYKQNHRVVSLLDTNNFGKMIYVEVGALLVGKIVNHDVQKFKKGDEKGYFKFGGSTIVIITKDNITIDEDILENSKNEIETKVYYGEKIGTRNKNT